MRTYDVFVSFRGEDTPNNFTGFLFNALRKKGIDAFRDDTDIKKGESIAPELLQAIEGSRIFVVVFSKSYASSTWCLCELAKICKYIDTSERHVLPVFYDVDPSEVGKQSGYYEKAFAEHEETFGEDKEKIEEVPGWREALTRVTNLSGWDIGNKPQYAKVEEIVKKITNILGLKFSSLPNALLVGMKSPVEELTKLLRFESVNDVQLVGISGIGGIGKTTLARALYKRITHQYNFRCFIDDVEQLKLFIGSRETLLHECLGGGSIIIIISRDKQILWTCDVYHVNPLNDNEAVQLFYKNAFRANYIMSDYKELTHDVLFNAQGHPLAIEVLGSSLFGQNQHAKEILDFGGFCFEYGLGILIDKSLITIHEGVIRMHDLLKDLDRCIVREKSPKEPIK
ncbi:hypothetical protein JHK87_015803 [Glycine soja]|uniref:TIR domain-containing protein n=1 Tax=Glycine max TaxID=3847 RepID=A0A0R0JJM6_SOYBN|nr:hypothetical protein JHK87_015803 [Glycine soja]